MRPQAHLTTSRSGVSRWLPAPGHIVETATALDLEGIMGTRHRVGYWGLVLLACFSAACINIDAPEPRSGHLSGRVLVAPGVGLARATVHVEQLHFYDGKGEFRRHVSSTLADDQGYFEAAPTSTAAGMLRLRTTGGSFRDLVSGELIELDSSTGLRTLVRTEFFDEREGLLITPVHSLIEGQFRHSARQLGDVAGGLVHAKALISAHFGGVDWDVVVPAELNQPVPSPVDAVRASFVLGGLSVLADDLRSASDSTPQAVNLLTLLDAAAEDLAAGAFDGNDGNDNALGSGLQVGTCPPVDPSCAAPQPGTCALGTCRPPCDLYSNSFRGALVGGIRKFVGSRQYPSPWNRTGLGAEDARPMLEHIGGNQEPELFGSACLETADRIAPTLVWEALDEGAFVKGTLEVKIRATDDAEVPPRAFFASQPDSDGDLTNHLATAIIDTRAVNSGADGPFSITAIARDLAGNERRSTRTLEVDNTAPVVTLDDEAFFVDGLTGLWWTAQPAPTLRGTVADAHAKEVQIVIGGEMVATAPVAGTTWSVLLPEGRLTSSGNEVTVRALDKAGNVTAITRTMRLDTTPPGVLMESSPVHDEVHSTVDYDLDNAATNTWLQRHVVGGTPIDLAQSMPGACVTVRKFSHLLFQDHVLGATGALNPLRLNLVVSDDGVGLLPGSEQVRVTRRTGSTTTEVLSWSTMSGTPLGGNATRYNLGLHRDGALAIPSLGTTEGEYHVEVRARDKLGRTVGQARCWNHRILAPKLRPTNGGAGARADGYDSSLYSTHLGSGATVGKFAARLLNDSAAGVDVWAWRVRNYLGVPVYVTVQISRNVNATGMRRFLVREAMTNAASAQEECNPAPNVQCFIGTPQDVYRSPDVAISHVEARFRARLFVAGPGNALGAELSPCPGCTNDDETQTYTFEIPARSTPQGSPLPEYVTMTRLRPTFPMSENPDRLPLTKLLAPQSAESPDVGTYGEFLVNGQNLTGRLVGGPRPAVCIAQQRDPESRKWFCTRVATPQTYRALLFASYKFAEAVDSFYRLSPHPSISSTVEDVGRLRATDSEWQSPAQTSPPIPTP
jgi:hypothetical protein